MGTTAESDIETELQSGDNVFTLGIAYSDRNRTTSDTYQTTSQMELQVSYSYTPPTVATQTLSDDTADQVTMTMAGTVAGHGDSILGYYPEKFLSGSEYIPEPTSVGSSPESYFKLDNLGAVNAITLDDFVVHRIISVKC